MNRQQRRQQARQNAHEAKQAYKRLKPQQQRELDERITAISQLERNGITAKALEDNYKIGFEEGFKKGLHEMEEPIFKVLYGAICLALKKHHKFGAKRCVAILNEVDQIISNTLDYEELIDEVWQEMGIQIDVQEVIHDRITTTKG